LLLTLLLLGVHGEEEERRDGEGGETFLLFCFLYLFFVFIFGALLQRNVEVIKYLFPSTK